MRKTDEYNPAFRSGMDGDLPMLRIRDLKKSFADTPVLDGIDLDVEKGEVVAILGPSGSGKTTLLRCMNFLEKADSGTLIFDGQAYELDRISKKDIRTIRSKTAFVFQSFNLFANRTALGNVVEGPVITGRMTPAEGKERGMQLLEKVGLADRADHYPAELSGGQQQRVAIARALATDPEIIYFDEPTSALDPKLKWEVLKVMSDLAHEGVTMLVVTHELSFAENAAHRVIYLENGEILEEASAKDFFGHPTNPKVIDFLAGGGEDEDRDQQEE